MIDFEDFFCQTASLPLSHFHKTFRSTLERCFYDRSHGDLNQWLTGFNKLPDLAPDRIDFNSAEVTIGSAHQISGEQRSVLLDYLKTLHPWRKGPWDLFGVKIDAEWRSNLKWDRVVPHMSSLKDRMILDIGCGNGYYMYRMLAQQPGFILGVDPSQLFLMQFKIFKKYLPDVPIVYLPLGDQDLPGDMQFFDTVISMGVLYHRRIPQEHLQQLYGCLRDGGEVVLETLVLENDSQDILEPDGRYAQMRNVWVVPSCRMVLTWLDTAGFTDIQVVDVTTTTSSEQRATEWMHFQSLTDYLDPDDPGLTVEGHPAPVRAVFIAKKP